MKKNIIKILGLLLSIYLLPGCNNNLNNKTDANEDYTHLVQDWNNAHSSKDFGVFSTLYDNNVLYYGTHLDKNDCIENKINFFKKYPDFYQQIYGDIQIEKLKDNNVKCSFVKRVTFNQKTTDYPSYLIFKKIDKSLKIITEGDLITDKNISKKSIAKVKIPKDAIKGNFNGDGQVDSMWLFKPNHILGVIIIIIVAIVLYFLFIKPKIIEPFHEGLNGRNAYKKTYSNNKPTYVNKDTDINTDSHSKEKGDLFEKFIVKKFDKGFYEVIEWRSDKYIDGHYATSNKSPDLEVQFKIKDFTRKFAVECKYRTKSINNQIEISKDYQLQNYNNYEIDKKIHVYVALGLGGSASKPLELFLIPLKHIQSNILYYDDIIHFRRAVNTQFYYDRVIDQLK